MIKVRGEGGGDRGTWPWHSYDSWVKEEVRGSGDLMGRICA